MGPQAVGQAWGATLCPALATFLKKHTVIMKITSRPHGLLWLVLNNECKQHVKCMGDGGGFTSQIAAHATDSLKQGEEYRS